MIQERKIVKVLSSLSKKELIRFDQYLKSPFFNKNEDLILIYNYLISYLKINKENKEIVESYIINSFKKQNKNLSKASLDKHLTTLLNYILNFLSFETFNSDHFASKISLLKYYVINNRSLEFEKLYFKLKQNLEKEKDSKKKFLNLLLVEELNYEVEKSAKAIVKENTDLPTFDSALDQFYYAVKIFNAVISLSRKQFIKSAEETFDNADLINNIISGNWLNETYINAFYLALELINNKELEKKKAVFDRFLLHLQKTGNEIEQKDLLILYSILQSQSKFVFTKKEEHNQFLFQLYKEQLDNKILYFNDTINYKIVTNICRVAILLEEYEWIALFLEHNQSKIVPEEFSEDVCDYNKARLFFFKKDFLKAQELVNQININDFYYQLSIRRLNILVNFELKNLELLESLILAFKTLINPDRTNFITNTIRLANKNFINYVHRLYRITMAVDDKEERFQRALKSLIEVENIPEKDWLVGKFDVKINKSTEDHK